MALYVVAHDGGCEGYSLPLLVFNDLQTAQDWCRGQSESFSVALVPVFPELPTATWYNVEEIKRDA